MLETNNNAFKAGLITRTSWIMIPFRFKKDAKDAAKVLNVYRGFVKTSGELKKAVKEVK